MKLKVLSKEQYKKIVVKHVMDIMDDLNSISRSPSKLAILLLLAQYDNTTKTTIYNMLKEAGIKISYKNTSANLDQMKKDGFVSYKKSKKDYNAVYVTLNKEVSKETIRNIVVSLNYVSEILI